MNFRQIIQMWKWVIITLGLLLALMGFLAMLAYAQYPATTAPKAAQVAMSAGQAMLLGLVEGVTEYLPVSSTGHLLLTQHLLGIDSNGRSKTAIDAYEICIQVGAILAVFLLYTRRIRSVFAGIFGKDKVGQRLAMNLLAAFLPAAIIGLLFEKLIKLYLFGLWPVTIAWLVGGIAILVVTRRKRSLQDASLGQQLEQLTIPKACLIGAMQCLAMWPGVSRSLVTILGGLFVGLSAMAAVEFSFLLGLVTLSAATLLEAVKHGTEIVRVFGWMNPLLGFVIAGVSAFFAVKWMVGYLNRHGLAIFGYYRLALGLIVAGLLFAGIIAT